MLIYALLPSPWHPKKKCCMWIKKKYRHLYRTTLGKLLITLKQSDLASDMTARWGYTSIFFQLLQTYSCLQYHLLQLLVVLVDDALFPLNQGIPLVNLGLAPGDDLILLLNFLINLCQHFLKPFYSGLRVGAFQRSFGDVILNLGHLSFLNVKESKEVEITENSLRIQTVTPHM